MDDRFLTAARRAPRPGFAAALKDRLADADAAMHARSFRRSRAIRRGLFTLAPVAAAVVALVAFPGVRAGAQAFLELFRVRNFVAVNVDPERVRALEARGADPLTLVGETVQATPPEPNRSFDTPAAAFLAAGYPAHEPAYLPEGLAADSAVLVGAQEVELRIEAVKLNELLGSLGIRDASLPPALDGARLAVRTSRAVGVRYRGASGNRQVHLLQAPHPEVSLPPGLERARLAEIGLRVLGLSADEARRFADRIDWNSSMLVPIPTGACTFREVEVGGRKGLLITPAAPDESARDRRAARHRADGQTLLWSDEDRIYALSGNLRDHEMLQMASSIP